MCARPAPPDPRSFFSCQPVGPPETLCSPPGIHFWSDATGGRVSSLINTNPTSSRTLISAGAMHPRTTQCRRPLELRVTGCFPQGEGGPQGQKGWQSWKTVTNSPQKWSGEADIEEEKCVPPCEFLSSGGGLPDHAPVIQGLPGFPLFQEVFLPRLLGSSLSVHQFGLPSSPGFAPGADAAAGHPDSLATLASSPDLPATAEPNQVPKSPHSGAARGLILLHRPTPHSTGSVTRSQPLSYLCAAEWGSPAPTKPSDGFPCNGVPR